MTKNKKNIGQDKEYGSSIKKAGPLSRIKVKQLEPNPWEDSPRLTEEFEDQRDFWQRVQKESRKVKR